jgi:hypothetical protein
MFGAWFVDANGGSRANGLIPCKQAAQQSRFLPLLAWIDGRKYPFVVQDVSWLEIPYGAAEAVQSKPRRGTLADISESALVHMLDFERCMALDRRRFLVTHTATGTNFQGLYHFNIAASSSFEKEFDTDNRLLTGRIELVAEVQHVPRTRILVLSHGFVNHGHASSGYAAFHVGRPEPQRRNLNDLITVSDNVGAAGPHLKPKADIVISREHGARRRITLHSEQTIDVRFLGVRNGGSNDAELRFRVETRKGSEEVVFRLGADGKFAAQRHN